MILWTTSAFTCRILRRLQCVRSCRCLKVLFYQVNVINCANVLCMFWGAQLCNIDHFGLDYLAKCFIAQSLLFMTVGVVEESMCTNKSCNQTNSAGNPAWSQKRIYNSCLHEFTYAEFTGHVTHRTCMHVHTSFIYRNKPIFFYDLLTWIEDRFTPAWCLPVCDVFADGA